ncbi:hypothetical protein [uncultured Tateyamaria sp.]|uniref:hypothetical protein n=1 Tax=uncultured Tateyamaria sp. TaxID=455651 RepID=UPI002619AB10|nr:hypothetical protein [uncultured Tateyamaria sp.]
MMIKLLLPALVLGFSPLIVFADTKLIDVDILESRQVHDVAKITPLAIVDGKPMVLLLDLPAGGVVPPHATESESGLRLLTVISGNLHWGDGTEMDQEQERVFPAGSVLVVSEQDPHWLAARDGALQLQLVTLARDTPVPGIQEQLE